MELQQGFKERALGQIVAEDTDTDYFVNNGVVVVKGVFDALSALYVEVYSADKDAETFISLRGPCDSVTLWLDILCKSL
ncbi:hypothetical protein J1614_007995 [Plenodomus biglobosus]|nr:hypothetical protein J1614_007995 [Plenodomus biglobosus]